MPVAQTDNAPEVAVSRRRGVLWDGVLPEGLGLCLVAIIFGGLAGGYLLTDYSWTQHVMASRQAETDTLTKGLAAAIGSLAEADEPAVDALMQNWGRVPRVRSLQWTAGDGSTRCEWPRARFAVPGVNRPQPPDADEDSRPTVGTAVAYTATGDTAGTVRVEMAAATGERGPLARGQRALLLWNWGIPTGITLLVFVALYRRLRRHLRPIVAIERNLHNCASGVEQELLTLTLSDSLGGVAQGWNRLIEQMTDLKRRLGEAQGVSQADVMVRFEGAIFRRVVDRLPVGVVCVDSQQLISYANASAVALLGRGGKELAGMAVSEAIDNPAVMQALVAVRVRSTAGLSIDHSSKEGEHECTLRFRVLPMSGPGGMAAAPGGHGGEALITVEDISHLREIERARDDFLYHVTHELRTPLTNIHAYTETLTQPDFDDEQTRKECYNVIISETKRLSTLIESILSVSQLEVGTARLQVGDVDLARLMRQMVQDNLGAADEKGIDLTLTLPPKVPKISADKQRLSVLLNNLIGNAVKYTPEKGKVQVSLEAKDERVLIHVCDDGIGIAPADQAHVFDKFYRAASDAVQMVTGTGLGLAIAREVARLHGGEISLESELGKGSTFTVELPLATADQPEVSGR